MPDQITICVDPGVSGGFVVASGSEVVRIAPMPETEAEIGAFLRSCLPSICCARIFIEHVSGYIGNAHPGAYMFTFGENFGLIKGWALGAQVPLEQVAPIAWQQRLQIGFASERADKPEWKRALKKEAIKRFPSLKPEITLKTADALLLWDFVRVHRPWRMPRPHRWE